MREETVHSQSGLPTQANEVGHPGLAGEPQLPDKGARQAGFRAQRGPIT